MPATLTTDLKQVHTCISTDSTLRYIYNSIYCKPPPKVCRRFFLYSNLHFSSATIFTFFICNLNISSLQYLHSLSFVLGIIVRSRRTYNWPTSFNEFGYSSRTYAMVC